MTLSKSAYSQPAELAILTCSCNSIFTNCPTFRHECFPTNAYVTFSNGGFSPMTYSLDSGGITPGTGSGEQEYFYILTNGSSQIQWDNYSKQPPTLTNTIILVSPAITEYFLETNTSLCNLVTNNTWEQIDSTNPTVVFSLVPVCYPDIISVTNSPLFNGVYELSTTTYTSPTVDSVHIVTLLTNGGLQQLTISAYYPPNLSISNFAELSYGTTNIFSYTNKDLCQMLPATNSPTIWVMGDTNAPILNFNCLH